MFSFLKSVITPASDEKAVAVVPSVVAAEVVDTVVTKPEETGPVLKEEITSIEEYNSYSPSEVIGNNLSSSGDAEINSAPGEDVEPTDSEQALDSFLEELTEDQPTMTTMTTNTASTDANIHNGYALKEQSVILPSVMEDPVSPVKEEKDDTWKNIISPVKLCEEETLKALSSRLETEKFEVSETWPLKAYAQSLRYEGADQLLVDTRVKLAKIILMRLRDAPDRNRKHYRTVVDLTLPLFNVKQNRRLFLVVVREFYHFWTGNPDAGFMVLKDGSGNILE